MKAEDAVAAAPQRMPVITEGGGSHSTAYPAAAPAPAAQQHHCQKPEPDRLGPQEATDNLGRTVLVRYFLVFAQGHKPNWIMLTAAITTGFLVRMSMCVERMPLACAKAKLQAARQPAGTGWEPPNPKTKEDAPVTQGQ
ncbi:hypothetical protein EAH_00058850 [Eimeria acervulina]|uniref:Uncharacterized protein n=1 Tax=Eimeria acervulina TaxID=5801 RepID=U6GPA6_EIMAC|nr:hypothetical protein EAH_00058850 [Eimeria acervulina]CDI81093.1 hypothetical protein EAH_00058850 [Eimeria acervulina]